MAPASSMDQVLPVEILVSAFKLLEDKDRCRLCLVSRRLQAILYHAPELWKRLDLSNRYTLGGDKFIEFDADHSKNATKILRALFATKRKELSTATIMLPSFARFSTIMRLDLSCTGIDPSFFSTCSVAEILASSLAQLILSGCPLVNSGSLYHLHTLKSLSYLDISHCEHVDDVGLEVLGFFVNWIKELNLGYLFKVTEVGVKKLLRMSGLRSLNLMGCCRIKSYPWAITNVNPNSTVALRELSIGEDSRIQTRGFWLLWCTWQHWDMRKLSTICPFLETLRLNMVLFDLPADGLQILLDECKHLKVLSLVIERNTITTLCGVAEKLRNLKSLDLTVHIGIQGEQMESLIAANALPRLKALKFHSKHTNVFNDTTIAQLIEKAPIIEYLELNGDELTSGCLGNVVKKVSGTLQSLLLHHVKISNTAMKEIAKNAKNLRDLTISDLQVDTHGVNDPILGARTHRTTKREMSLMGLGAANKLRWLVSDAAICMKLKKIELASYDGFCDKDLAEVPKHCVNLQWVDFHFSFTFPKTLAALGKYCPGLLYLRLFHCNPPIAFDVNTQQTPRVVMVNGQPRLSTTISPSTLSNSSTPSLTTLINSARRSIATTLAPLPLRVSIPQRQPSGLRRPTSTTSPFMATLYGNNSSLSNKRRGSERSKKQQSPSSPTRKDVPLSRVSEQQQEFNPRVSVAKNSMKPKSKAKYPCSSDECQALIEFAMPTAKKSHEEAPKFAKRLRVLDLSGNHGVSDYIISNAFANGLTSLHTLFLEGCDESLTESGIVKFAEARFRSIKRLHIRNCKGVSMNVVQENFLKKGLEIDVIVDGGRLRSLD